ncbi:MAG TPA: glycerate kinase [Chitinophagaceae bacterium]|nr:glycerate kinase [Chitinophagaceae bacterium]
MRDHAIQIFRSAVEAVQPAALLPAFISLEPPMIRLGEQYFAVDPAAGIQVLSVGKAAAAMALSAEALLGSWIRSGLVVTKEGHSLPLSHFEVMEAGHPVPDRRSLQAGEILLERISDLSENDLVLLLLSGGASSLLADCPAGVSLQELQSLTAAMLRSGADIHEINTVRKHLSPGIKGGRLARAAYPARVCTLIISDVLGDSTDSIASGPTVPDSTRFSDAWQVINKYNLSASLSLPMKQWLMDGLEGKTAENPLPGDPVFDKVSNLIIGNNTMALQAAARAAGALGFNTFIIDDAVRGESREVAVSFVKQLMDFDGDRPACLLMGGETTVTLSGHGKGGRNQEFVLAAYAALRKHYQPDTWPVLLSAGTDGSDGPTDAAGAIIDPALHAQVSALGLSPQYFLDNNDSYHFFDKAGGLLKTGATQTNVMDIMIGLLY